MRPFVSRDAGECARRIDCDGPHARRGDTPDREWAPKRIVAVVLARFESLNNRVGKFDVRRL
jgi:hypothetical protein